MLKTLAYALMTFISPVDGISVDAHVHVFQEGQYTEETCRLSLDHIWAEFAPVIVLEAGCFTREIDVPETRHIPTEDEA